MPVYMLWRMERNTRWYNRERKIIEKEQKLVIYKTAAGRRMDDRIGNSFYGIS